tara:strand:- start:204 stop:620 length:417 start_codon:yes stop_codon:yes gene_type:complete
MPKNKICIILLSVVLSFFSCGEKEPENGIVGNWSAKYIINQETELLGYYDSELTYSLKPALFSPNGKMIIFLKNENKNNIEAEYTIQGKDSILIESDINLLNGLYKIELKNEMGKRIMKFRATNKEMYFEQINGHVNF